MIPAGGIHSTPGLIRSSPAGIRSPEPEQGEHLDWFAVGAAGRCAAPATVELRSIIGDDRPESAKVNPEQVVGGHVAVDWNVAGAGRRGAGGSIDERPFARRQCGSKCDLS